MIQEDYDTKVILTLKLFSICKHIRYRRLKLKKKKKQLGP